MNNIIINIQQQQKKSRQYLSPLNRYRWISTLRCVYNNIIYIYIYMYVYVYMAQFLYV